MPITVRTARTRTPANACTLPSPATFGDLLPAKFTNWRGDQPRAICSTIDSARRVVAQAAPTGFGKSLMYVAIAQLTDQRTCILTSTKGLQEQLLGDFNGDGIDRLVDIRGQNAYRCVRARDFGYDERTTCDYAPCHAGRQCSSKDGGCLYYDQYRKALGARIVVTNYAYWLSINKYGKGLGKFDMLVLDEAHDVPDILAEFMSVEIDPSELPATVRMHDTGADIDQWREWARFNLSRLSTRMDQLTAQMRASITPSKDMARESGQLKRLIGKLEALSTAQDDWVIERVTSKSHGNSYVMRFDPIWPWKSSEALLFRGIEHIVLVSATLREKTARLLGVSDDALDFYEYNSSFPVKRRPIIHVPTTQMNFRTSPANIDLWLTRIDQIIGARLDRKGIIHTVSFARAKAIIERSEYRQHMVLNESKNTRWVIDQFKRASAPRILVSPSVTTGYDFPYDECRYQIIGKLPFPDNRALVIKARMQHDRQYSNYMTMQTLIQMCGRPMRAEDDWCETLVLDDNVQWFMDNNKQFAPKWFRDALVWATHNPQPPPMSGPR